MLGKMQDRLAGWRLLHEATAIRLHGARYHSMSPEFSPEPANGAGLTWHYCRPPIEDAI